MANIDVDYTKSNPALHELVLFANSLTEAAAYYNDNPGADGNALQAEVDARLNDVRNKLHMQWVALENCRLLAQRCPSESWAQNILRYCASVNCVPKPLRG
jgi:tRNA A37 threonylcarbamoyladenosine synthetase subunit TsaC/SUA5/YrdC